MGYDLIHFSVCTSCGSRNFKIAHGTYSGVPYRSYKCSGCGEEVFTMDQARVLAKAVEHARQVTFSKWGKTLAIRIPAEVVRRLGLFLFWTRHPCVLGKGFTVEPIKG